MSFVIGRQRSLSHSCLVASSIEMPVELEEELENLDDIFQKQLNWVRNCQAYIEKNADHHLMAPWPYLKTLAVEFRARTDVVWKNDYLRAHSYGAMRIVNTRMTDIINAISPVRLMMERVIKPAEDAVKHLDKVVDQIWVDIDEATKKVEEAKQMVEYTKKGFKLTRRASKTAACKLKEATAEDQEEKLKEMEWAKRSFEGTEMSFVKAMLDLKEAERFLKESEDKMKPARKAAKHARLYAFGKIETIREKQHREYGEELQRKMDDAQLAAALRYDIEKYPAKLKSDWRKRGTFGFDIMKKNR